MADDEKTIGPVAADLPKGDYLAGDEEVYSDEHMHKVEPEVTDEQTPTVQPGYHFEPEGTVPLHETYVQMDEVITDPSDPRAVQVPDAGRGYHDLPIWQLGQPTVEERFDEGYNNEDDRALPGTTVGEDEKSAPDGTDSPKTSRPAPKASGDKS